MKAMAMIEMLTMMLLVGITPQLVVTILSAIESTKDTADLLDWVFIILLPNYNMGQGIANLYNNHNYVDLCYNKFPPTLNQTKGKEGLDKICEFAKQSNNSVPCCKGCIISYPSHVKYI